MSGISSTSTSRALPSAPVLAASQAPQPAAEKSAPALASDRFEINQEALDRARAASRQQGQAEIEKAAERGARIGGATGNALTGGYFVVKGFKGGIAAPTKLLGKAFSVVGVGFSGYSLGKAGVELVKDLTAPDPRTCSAIKHGMEVVGNGLVIGGSIAVASGAGAAPGAIAVGSGILLDAGASLIECKEGT